MIVVETIEVVALVVVNVKGEVDVLIKVMVVVWIIVETDV